MCILLPQWSMQFVGRGLILAPGTDSSGKEAATVSDGESGRLTRSMPTLTDDSTSKSVSLNQIVSQPAALKDDRKKCISGVNSITCLSPSLNHDLSWDICRAEPHAYPHHSVLLKEARACQEGVIGIFIHPNLPYHNPD